VRRIALVGDVAVLGVLTVAGFVTHGTLGDIGRLLITVAAFLAAWFWTAPWFGVYRDDYVWDWRQVWRALWAWSLAAPLGAVVRALLLNTPITPVFVVVSIAVNGAGLVLWRLLLAWGSARRAGAV
jgi:hypothetical protein